MGDAIPLEPWLAERGITLQVAKEWCEKIKQEFPVLAAALKAHKDVTGELELMAVIDLARRGYFCPPVVNPE